MCEKCNNEHGEFAEIMTDFQNKKRRSQPEATIQTQLYNWARNSSQQYPELALMFHVPNGGKRNVVTAMALKRQGVKAGVPDNFLPVAKRGKHGLFIELKHGNNTTTSAQKAFIDDLTNQGYQVNVCKSVQEAQKVIADYLGLPPQAI